MAKYRLKAMVDAEVNDGEPTPDLVVVLGLVPFEFLDGGVLQVQQADGGVLIIPLGSYLVRGDNGLSVSNAVVFNSIFESVEEGL